MTEPMLVDWPTTDAALAVVRDESRLAALRRTLLLDSPVEEAFDRLTRLAMKMLHAPVALITLVDADRQFFKSSIGLAEPWAAARQTDLSHSFCQHTIASNEPFIVEDARGHPLVADNLAIRDLDVIAYAGIPLVLEDGSAIGAFCVIDTEPRHWTGDEIDILRDLAGSVMAAIDLRAKDLLTHQLLDELEIERSRLRAVLEQMPSGVIIAEVPSGKLVLGNPQIDQILGYPFFAAEDVQGYTHYQGFHTDGRPYLAEEWPLARTVMQGVTVRDEEIEILRGDGTRGWIDNNSAPIRDAEGKIVAAVLVLSDITERKRSQDHLQFLATAGTVLGSTLDYELTLKNIAQLTVPQLADYCAVHMVEADGAVRQLAMAAGVPGDAERTEAIIRQYPAHRDGLQRIRQVTRTGQPELVSVIADDLLRDEAVNDEHLESLRELDLRSFMIVPIVTRDVVVGTITFITSSSRRHYTIDDLRFAQELARRAGLAIENARLYGEAQEAVREREAILSIASHELRNPLTSMLGHAALLERRVVTGKAVSEREQRQIQTIIQQGDRMNRMLTTLLDVTRLETGQLIVAQDDVDLHLVVTGIIEEIEPSLTTHRIVYELPDSPAIVSGDELRLEQVVRNLVGNAVKYTPAGGDVLIRLVDEADRVRLIVQDHGIGIPAAAIPTIFQRFSRVQHPRAEQISGLGLGLYVVKEIVTLHGGTIEVESVENEGSTFCVSLPRRHV